MIRCAGSFGGEVAFVDFDDNVVGRSSIGHGCTVRLESLLFGCKKIKKVQGGQKGGKLSRQNPLRGNWFLRFSQTCFVYGAFFKNTFKKKRSARGGAKINSLLISGLLTTAQSWEAWGRRRNLPRHLFRGWGEDRRSERVGHWRSTRVSLPQEIVSPRHLE